MKFVFSKTNYLREQKDTAAQDGQGRGAQDSIRQWQQVEARAGVGSSLQKSIEMVFGQQPAESCYL